MNFNDILRITSYLASAITGCRGVLLWAEAGGAPGVDATTALVVGVVTLIVGRIVDAGMKAHRDQSTRDDLRAKAELANDTRAVQLDAQLRASQLTLAMTAAELKLWRAKCSTPPTAREIRAAQQEARKRLEDPSDDMAEV